MNESNSRGGRRIRRRGKQPVEREKKEDLDLDPAWAKYKDDLVLFTTFMGKALGPLVDITLIQQVHHGDGLEVAGEGGSFTAVVIPTSFDEETASTELPPGIVKFPNETGVSNAWQNRLDSLLSEIRVLTARWVRKHPNITQLSQMVWKAATHPGKLVYPGLRLEAAPHGTLHDFLLPDRFSFSWRSKLLLCRDVARALSFLHDCGVAHCDVKPENILLFPCGQTERLGCPLAKISDFSHSVFECHHRDGLVTWRGCTVQWAAPEVLESSTQKINLIHLADVYSFGLFFWYMLNDGEDITSTDQGTSAAELGILSVALDSVTAEPKDFNVSVASQILNLTLQRKPEDRVPTMHVLLDILDKEISRYEPPRRTKRLITITKNMIST
jgi:serine/threonine protein kinase